LRATTESGELLISRKTHQLSLFLVAYYNHYGRSHYYPLFTQGGAGEGDKETWLAAAIAMNQTFYHVREPIKSIGRSLWGSANGAAMVQYDPVEDFRWASEGLFGQVTVSDKGAARPKPLFIHANQPKFSPRELVGKSDDEKKGPTWHDGRRSRVWPLIGPVIWTLGGDVERQLWEEVMWVACELEGKFIDLRKYNDNKSMCERVRNAWDEIFVT
jgi:alpha 1,2-mannosyltransferase